MTPFRAYCAHDAFEAASRKTKSVTTLCKSLLLAASIAGILGGCGSKQHEPPVKAAVTGKVMLVGVTVVRTQDGSLTPNMSILMDAGKIVSTAPAGAAAPDALIETIDAHGKFVVPGYLEKHAHPLGKGDPTGTLELMLANGITGFHQMQGSSELLAERKAGALEMPQDSPALLGMPGTILNPLNAGTPEAAVATVRQQKAEGADFIKVIAVNAPTFFAAQAEAKRLGLPYIGHLPSGVDAAAASKGGMKSMEHLGAGDSIPIACSSDEEALKQELAKLPPLKGPPFKIPFMDKIVGWYMEKLVANPYAKADARDIVRLQHAIDTYSEDKCRQLAATFVANGTWQVPTLIRLHTMEMGDAPEFVNDHLRYMAPTALKLWRSVAQDFTENLSPATKQTLRQAYAMDQKIVKLFDTAGVKMATGSDMGGAFLVPGFSLHQEFDELEKAGISPLHVLQMATLNGAEFVGKTATIGSVEAGKYADLVLLDANPIDGVQNMHKIFAVVRAGRYYSRQQLDALKNRVLTEHPAGH
ncbi:amidohydrolase family protein [Variovorax sp. dw_954]|uniref:amidohydrolase family protein n=1 Tax=Variovorax sp. dw_954 TaxID=2720078 RepID=UPI001BD1F132|nr:amidohydrolase family protein [Variovorax sp. dw_954]